MPETVYLDLETTGLYPPDDEVVEIAVVDAAGAVRLHSLVRPVHTTTWPDTEAIHGLTPVDGQDAPTLEALRPQIVEALRGTTVVIYNAAFDQTFLPVELAAAAELRCCMEAFAAHYGEWNESHGGFTWQRLSTAAEYVRYRWDSRAHRAVADALACRAVWRYLTEPEERQRVEALKADEQASWEAQAALREWAYVEQRAQEREGARLTSWWAWWWLRREAPAPHQPQYIRAYQPDYKQLRETYCQLFTGYTLDVLEAVEVVEGLGLPGYRRCQDIPAHLKPTSYFRTQPDAWVLAHLRERAYYVSTRGKRFSWLYDVREGERIVTQHLPRYRWGWPEALATKTQLLKAGVPRARVEALPPVAEYYHGLHHCWYPLYQRPAAPLEQRTTAGMPDRGAVL